MYPIIKNYLRQNRSYESLKPVGIVLHETATPGATAEDSTTYFNNNQVAASAHAFVDWTSIVHTVPWNEVSWHAGPTANHKFIGIELCRPAEFNEQQFKEVWDRSVWLFAHIYINVLKVTDVTPDNLLSHAEVSNLWGETNHQDPIVYFTEYGKTVNDFRNAVQLEINRINNTTPNLNDIQGHWAEKDITSLLRKGILAGYEDGSFKPDQPVTRAEAAVIAARVVRYILGED